MRQTMFCRALSIAALVGGSLAALPASANELGGVRFEWTRLVGGEPYKGRFVNTNPGCKLVTWYAMSADGRSALSPSGTSRIDGQSTLDIQISNQAGSANVIIQAVKDC